MSLFLSIVFATIAIYVTVKITCLFFTPCGKSAVVLGRDQKEKRRLLEPVEQCLEEIHQLGVGNVCAVLRLSSKVALSPHHVKKAIDKLIHKHPLLRSAIVKDEAFDVNNRRYFQEVPTDYSKVLKRSNKPDVQWQTVWEEECDANFDTANGPLWSTTWLQECFDEHSSMYENTFIFKCHHAIVDGISILHIARQFTASLNSIEKGQESRDESYPMMPGVHTLAASQLEWKTWQKWLLIPNILKLALKVLLPFQSKFSTTNCFLTKFPSVSLSYPTQKSETKVVFAKLSTKELEKLVEKSRQHGCTVQGTLATACHFALANLIQDEGDKKGLELQWQCAVTARRNCRPRVNKNHIGCFATSLLHKIKVPATRNQQSFWEVARGTSKELKEGISAGDHLTFLKFGALLDPNDAAKASVLKETDMEAGTFDTNTISNVGCYDWPEESDVTYHVQDAFFLTSVAMTRFVFTHFITTFRGSLYWAACYNGRIVLETNVKQYMKLIWGVLTEVTA